MTDLQLVLKFKVDGEAEWRIRGAARISVNGGRLTLFAHPTRAFESIPLSCIEGLSIQSLPAVANAYVN